MESIARLEDLTILNEVAFTLNQIQSVLMQNLKRLIFSSRRLQQADKSELKIFEQ